MRSSVSCSTLTSLVSSADQSAQRQNRRGCFQWEWPPRLPCLRRGWQKPRPRGTGTMVAPGTSLRAASWLKEPGSPWIAIFMRLLSLSEMGVQRPLLPHHTIRPPSNSPEWAEPRFERCRPEPARGWGPSNSLWFSCSRTETCTRVGSLPYSKATRESAGRLQRAATGYQVPGCSQAFQRLQSSCARHKVYPKGMGRRRTVPLDQALRLSPTAPSACKQERCAPQCAPLQTCLTCRHRKLKPE